MRRCRSISIAAVIGKIQAEGHYSVAYAYSSCLKNQIAGKIIYIAGTAVSRRMAVICPVILKAGMIAVIYH